MLKFLWLGVVPHDIKGPLDDIITMLLDEFEIGYAIGKPNKEGRIDVIRPYEPPPLKDDEIQSFVSVNR